MPAGAEWRHFNTAQKGLRQDMVQLYGNSRNLVPADMGAGSRGDRSLSAFFALQVSLIRLALMAPHDFCAALM